MTKKVDSRKELFEKDDIGGFRNHNIRNPYIIIIGISDYSQSKNITNLPAVKEDVENMYHLFKNEFGYKYVYKHLNKFKVKDKELDIKSRREFGRVATKHREEIEELEETEDKIDGIIFIYSGHGDEGVILGNKGNKIGIPHIHAAFDNEELPFMEKRPRLYIFDCCRGGDMEIGKSTESKRPMNVSKDTVYWYGSSEGMKAFERSDKKGSIFLTEIYTVLYYMLKKQKYWNLSSVVSTLVFKKVMQEKGQNQTPEYKKQIGYEIYLCPSKTSKYIVQEEETELNRQGSYVTDKPDLSTQGGKDSNKPKQKEEDLDVVLNEIYEGDKESIPFKEGFLFGGALGDYFISKVKKLVIKKKIEEGQISDITEMNIAMMYGIKNMIENIETPEPTPERNEDTQMNKDETKENDDNTQGRNDEQLNLNNNNGFIFDIKHIALEYKLWMENNKITNKFLLGNTIKHCLVKNTVQNMKYYSQKMNKESKMGGTKSNGSLMRISPLILFLLSLGIGENNDYQSIFLILKEDSELTHYNYTCHIINGVLFFIIQYLLTNYKDENKNINAIKNGEKFLDYLVKLFSNNKNKFKNYIKNLKEVKQWLLNGKQKSRNKLFKLSAGAYIRVAFEYSIFYLFNKCSITKAFRDVAQLKEKSDAAVCYVVGSVLGAYYGIGKLPKQLAIIRNYKSKNEKINKYQTFQYVQQQYIKLLNLTRNLSTIRIYKPSDNKSDDDNLLSNHSRNNNREETNRFTEERNEERNEERDPERKEDDNDLFGNDNDLFSGGNDSDLFGGGDDNDLFSENNNNNEDDNENDLKGLETIYVDHTPGMNESNFIRALFYEEMVEEKN